MASIPEASEHDRLIEATYNQSDTNETHEEFSWGNTAVRVLKLAGWLFLSLPIFTLYWTAGPIAEHGSAIGRHLVSVFSTTEEEDRGVGAVMPARYGSIVDTDFPRHGMGNEFTLKSEERILDGFVGVDSDAIPDSVVESGQRRAALSAVENIRGGSYTEKGTVYTYIDFLERKYGDQAIFIGELIDPMPKPNIFEDKIIPEVVRAVEEGKQFVFIPVVQASSRDHIVLFALNLENGAIEYFDPKGKAPGANEIRALPGVSVSAFRSMLTQNLFDPVSEIFGEKENPDLVELRDLLAQKDHHDIQATLKKHILGSDKLNRQFGFKGPALGHAIYSVFAHRSPSIPELKKVIAACQKEKIGEVRSALSMVSTASFPAELEKQMKYMYRSDFDVEELRTVATKELEKVQNLQDGLLHAVSREILLRGSAKNPYRNGTQNYSYGSKTPHQGRGDWKNCGRFVMHFMKMRLEQSLRPKDGQDWYRDEERVDFIAATAAVKKSKAIQQELIADLY
ncbi:hypothetical protein [Simkania sp.]|uniref:hypothetical protein n=1 Tax=Simkania sp. TaxID=34094 RepID=UPI003B5230E4